MDPEPLREFVAALALESGREIARRFQSEDLGVERKFDDSVVTIADREAEHLMRDRIRARFPDHGVIGEEYGADNEDAEFLWVLDPIDGTLSFVAGVPLFGTLIALLHEGEPVLGAIHQPITGELVIGTSSGTTLNERAVRVRPCDAFEDATLLTTDPKLIAEHKGIAGFEVLRRRAALYRGWGDCYGYLMVATGRADIMLDPIMNLWDIAALVPVVRGAGGVITTWEGTDAIDGTSTVAAGPGLHGQIIEILNGET